MVEIRIPLIRRIIAFVAHSFFEDSGYKADLHADLTTLIMEIKNLNTMVYALIAENKNVIMLYKLNKGDTQQRRLR